MKTINETGELNIIGGYDNHVQCYLHDTYYMAIPNKPINTDIIANESYRMIVDIRSLPSEDQLNKENPLLLERLYNSIEEGYVYVIPIINQNNQENFKDNDRKKANYISNVINQATTDIITSEEYKNTSIEPVVSIMSSDNSEEKFVEVFHHFFETRTIITRLDWLQTEKEIHKPKSLVKENDDGGFAKYQFLFIASAILIAIYLVTIFVK